MTNVIFIESDSPSGQGTCPHHVSPTCHPAQTDAARWKYACAFKAWKADFLPIVECGGEPNRCEVPAQILRRTLAGKRRSEKFVEARLRRVQTEIGELEDMLTWRNYGHHD